MSNSNNILAWQHTANNKPDLCWNKTDNLDTAHQNRVGELTSLIATLAIIVTEDPAVFHLETAKLERQDNGKLITGPRCDLFTSIDSQKNSYEIKTIYTDDKKDSHQIESLANQGLGEFNLICVEDQTSSTSDFEVHKLTNIINDIDDPEFRNLKNFLLGKLQKICINGKMKNTSDTMLCDSDLYPLRRMVDQIKFSQTPKEDLEQLIASNAHEDRTYYPMSAPFNCFAPLEGKKGLQTVTKAHIPTGYQGHITSITKGYNEIKILSKTRKRPRPEKKCVKNNRSIQYQFNKIIGNTAKTGDFHELINAVNTALGYRLTTEREININ